MPPRPTDTELEILQVLWKLGPSSVREVLDALPRGRRIGYTTVLKLLQIMHGKGLVHRDESERRHVYRAAQSEDQAQRSLVREVIQRVFAGSASRLVQQALSGRRTTREELAAIRALLDEAEERAGRKSR